MHVLLRWGQVQTHMRVRACRAREAGEKEEGESRGREEAFCSTYQLHHVLLAAILVGKVGQELSAFDDFLRRIRKVASDSPRHGRRYPRSSWFSAISRGQLCGEAKAKKKKGNEKRLAF